MATQTERFDTVPHPTEAAPVGVLGGSRIRTLDGTLPVEFLSPGDRIVTRAGARRLAAVSVLQRRHLDLVCIRASTLGHDRPDGDLWLAPDQLVIVRDWRARVLYGTEAAAVPATRLVDGEFVLRRARVDLRLFALRFDEDEVIWAEGLELACPVTVNARLSALG